MKPNRGKKLLFPEICHKMSVRSVSVTVYQRYDGLSRGNSEGANVSADITTRGGSPASILQIHPLHHAAANTPSHCVIGCRAKIMTI